MEGAVFKALFTPVAEGFEPLEYFAVLLEHRSSSTLESGSRDTQCEIGSPVSAYPRFELVHEYGPNMNCSAPGTRDWAWMTSHDDGDPIFAACDAWREALLTSKPTAACLPFDLTMAS